MKILMINDYKYEIGGAEVYLFNIQKKLVELGHTVELFSTDITRDEYVKGLQNVSYTVLLKRLFNPKTLAALKKKLVTFKPDIIHIHSYYELSPSFLLGVEDIPCVMTIHDERIAVAVTNQELRNGKKCKMPLCPGCVNCVGITGSLYQSLKRRIHNPLLKKIKLFITPSMFLYKRIKEYTSFKPLKQLYNGFTLLPYKPSNHSKKILFVGRLTKDKGIDYLLEALPSIVNHYPDVHLTLVGNGDEKKELTQLVKELNMNSYVTFHNAVPHTKIAEFIYDSEVVCIPSICNDNLPTICIEAMSAGRAVVASKIGGLPELITDGIDGLLFPEKNAAAIAKSISYIFENKEKTKQLGIKAHQSIQKCDIETHIPKLITIYQSLI